MKKLNEELLNEGLINDQEFNRIDAITSGKVISLYYELRLVLYLGILLFTGSIGYMVYQNMSNVGHIVLMFLMLMAIIIGAYFIYVKSKPYSNGQVKVDAIYFDYLLVLVSLLVISLFTYFQVYFELVEILIQWTSGITATLFLFLAYRFDNKMILSLGITAFAATFGLTVSPVDWVNGNWLEDIELYTLSFSLGCLFLIVGQVLNYKDIKKHFTFTWQNFGWLLFYFGGLTFVMDYGEALFSAAILLLICVVISIYYWRIRSFLFFIYATFVGYILCTYLVFSMNLNGDALFHLGVFYFPITCIGGVILLIKNKSHFTDDQ